MGFQKKKEKKKIIYIYIFRTPTEQSNSLLLVLNSLLLNYERLFPDPDHISYRYYFVLPVHHPSVVHAKG